MVKGMGVRIEDPKYQTFWEFLTLFLALMVWGSSFTRQSAAVVGDNTGSLTSALKLKAKGCMAAIARELSWRRERLGWQFEVGHLPSELNVVPDALSRQYESKPAPWPTAALRGAIESPKPDFARRWQASRDL